jgi:hypothetical protein
MKADVLFACNFSKRVRPVNEEILSINHKIYELQEQINKLKEERS